MHSMKIGEWNIHYNGDFSGDIHFDRRDGKEKIRIPFSVVEALVAEKVRAERIAQLEDASTEELLR